MIKKFPNFKPHSDTETEELISLLFRKLDIDELIFLLRVLQRDIRVRMRFKIWKFFYHFKFTVLDKCI